MAISGHHTTSHTNHHIGVRRFHREIICKRQNTINLVLFGNPFEIAIILSSDLAVAIATSPFAINYTQSSLEMMEDPQTVLLPLLLDHGSGDQSKLEAAATMEACRVMQHGC